MKTTPITIIVMAAACHLLCLHSFAQTPPDRVEPTFKDVQYGPHKEQNLNFWKIESDKPTPLLVQIHGGGWLGGEKNTTVPARQLTGGYSFCSIAYRLTKTDLLPAPVYDAARAIQFLRSKAADWNIDPDRIIVMGGSAGAATSLWLAFHDDLADPQNSDPVLRQSTRVSGVVGLNGQTTLDPFVITQRIGPACVAHSMIWHSVGAANAKDLMDHWDKYKKLSLEFSPIEHVTPDDPPVYLQYRHVEPTPVQDNVGAAIHHAAFGILLKEKCDAVGVKCMLSYPGSGEPMIDYNKFIQQIFFGK